ncbi:unnamed protein product [Adineta ricciae]|nr:unnamed protein product [Adineta ricciae]
MSGREIEQADPAKDVPVVSTTDPAETKLVDQGQSKAKVTPKEKKSVLQAVLHFVYNPQQKTVLGRSSLNWAKLALFYSVFFFCLGSFFVGFLYLFALFTDSNEPRYTNTESTMAVRTTATVVGLGFRPQPIIDDNLIRVTNTKQQQEQIASSLSLFRQVYLTQKSDAKTEVCSANNPASELPQGFACEFDWSDIVKNDDHPCSEKNLYGFQQEQPCVLVKLNKVYGWTPSPGRLPEHIVKLQGGRNSGPIQDPDVYITCEGAHPADKDVLTDLVYYSMDNPNGSPSYGTIPNHFFPYRNAPDHVQPFVLVQFKKLPLDRLNDQAKLFLTIAVLSSHERLNDYLPAILETWALTTTMEIEIVIFLEETSSTNVDFLDRIFSTLNTDILACLYIVKLKHVENHYPPQKKSFYAMKFLYTFYQHRTSWVLRLDDNAYVHIEKLIPWLKSIDHRQALYIGQGGTGRRNGPAVHFPPEKYFCMGGSGVILSQQTLMQLGPWLDQCYRNELLTNHEDVELGRCILTHVQIGCTNAYDSKVLFYHHYGPYYSFGDDFTPKIISHAFILHPIKNRTVFRQLYSFFLRQNHHPTNISEWKPLNSETHVTFLNNRELDTTRDIQLQLIDGRWKVYIDTTVRSYIERLQKIWYHRSSNWTVANGKATFGYHRAGFKHGLELITEILLNLRSTHISPVQSLIVRKRFYIRQGLVNQNRMTYREIINVNHESQLNLIVVANNKDNALLRFIRNFHDEILHYSARKPLFTLTILYFSQNNSSALNLIYQLSVRYPSAIHLSIVNSTQHTYNRGLGRQLASNYFTTNQLLFFLDVDLTFTGQALVNTREMIIHLLSISSCAVYFPIVYSTFSNTFNPTYQQLSRIEKDSGLFSIYGFGNVAVRKGDLDRVGGWELNNHEWGIEDVNLFQRFVNRSAECYVFRAVEPDLRHYYHKKMCQGIQNPAREKMCIDAEASLLGSQKDMVNYIFKHELI